MCDSPPNLGRSRNVSKGAMSGALHTTRRSAQPRVFGGHLVLVSEVDGAGLYKELGAKTAGNAGVCTDAKHKKEAATRRRVQRDLRSRIVTNTTHEHCNTHVVLITLSTTAFPSTVSDCSSIVAMRSSVCLRLARTDRTRSKLFSTMETTLSSASLLETGP